MNRCTDVTSHCLLESKVSRRILNSSVPSMPALEICVLLKENSFSFSSLFKTPLFQSRIVIGVLPSPTLVHGSFPCR